MTVPGGVTRITHRSPSMTFYSGRHKRQAHHQESGGGLRGLYREFSDIRDGITLLQLDKIKGQLSCTQYASPPTIILEKLGNKGLTPTKTQHAPLPSSFRIPRVGAMCGRSASGSTSCAECGRLPCSLHLSAPIPKDLPDRPRYEAMLYQASLMTGPGTNVLFRCMFLAC